MIDYANPGLEVPQDCELLMQLGPIEEKLEILRRYFTDICAYTGIRGVDRDWKKCSSGLLGSNNVKWRFLAQGSLLCFLISNSVSFLYMRQSAITANRTRFRLLIWKRVWDLIQNWVNWSDGVARLLRHEDWPTVSLLSIQNWRIWVYSFIPSAMELSRDSVLWLD